MEGKICHLLLKQLSSWMWFISVKESCFLILNAELDGLIYPGLGTAGQDRALPSHSAKEAQSLHWRGGEDMLPGDSWFSREIKKGVGPRMPSLPIRMRPWKWVSKEAEGGQEYCILLLHMGENKGMGEKYNSLIILKHIQLLGLGYEAGRKFISPGPSLVPYTDIRKTFYVNYHLRSQDQISLSAVLNSQKQITGAFMFVWNFTAIYFNNRPDRRERKSRFSKKNNISVIYYDKEVLRKTNQN